jgi:hypothetical protein
MSQKPIPESWRMAVIKVLKSGRWGKTDDFYTAWQNDFPKAYKFELEQAFIQALSSPSLTGCHVTMDRPPGETWEFYFLYDDTRTYGKILLRNDSSGVVVFSAHRPRKPKLSCE